MNKFIGKAIVG